jgi:hypothetical protein
MCVFDRCRLARPLQGCVGFGEKNDGAQCRSLPRMLWKNTCDLTYNVETGLRLTAKQVRLTFLIIIHIKICEGLNFGALSSDTTKHGVGGIRP